MTINKAHVTFQVNNYTREQFEENPDFEFTSSGFVLRETVEDLTVAPVITCDVMPESPVGRYPINISGAESPNYDFTYVPGMLIVSPSTSVTPSSLTQPASPAKKVFTLSGQQVTSPLQPGVYIVGNRKMVVK